MTTTEILSIIAACSGAIVAIWMKILSSRVFKALDDKIKRAEDTCKDTDARCQLVEKECVRLTADSKNQERELQQIKGEIIREVQTMNNHVEIVHKKIDHMDTKLDNLRTRGKS